MSSNELTLWANAISVQHTRAHVHNMAHNIYIYIHMPSDRSGAYIWASFLVIFENVHRTEFSRQPLPTFALLFHTRGKGWIGLTSKLGHMFCFLIWASVRKHVVSQQDRFSIKHSGINLVFNLGFCKKKHVKKHGGEKHHKKKRPSV